MLNTDPIGWVLCGYAAISALHHFIGTKALERYAISQGLLSADRSVKITALLLVGIAVCFTLDDLAVFGGYGLGGFLLISAFTVHKFWDIADPTLRVSESLHFTKNLFFGAIVVLYYV